MFLTLIDHEDDGDIARRGLQSNEEAPSLLLRCGVTTFKIFIYQCFTSYDMFGII